MLVVVSIVCVMTGSALGQQVDPTNAILDAFTGGGDRLSSALLSQIFGCRLFPVAGIPCDESQLPVFATVIHLFNTFCLVLATVLFSWNISAGVAQTAHEGRVLGSRWSTLWAPIRTVTAIGMLVTLPGMQGYNTVQAGIAYLVRGSTTAASVVWGQAADGIVTLTAPIVLPGRIIDTSALGPLWEIAVCQQIVVHVANKWWQDTDGNDPGIGLTTRMVTHHPPVETSPDDILQGRTDHPSPRSRIVSVLIPGSLTADDIAATGLDNPGICGIIHIPEPPRLLGGDAQLQSDFIHSHHDAVVAALTRLRHPAGALVREAEDGSETSQATMSLATAIVQAGQDYHGVLANSLGSIGARAGSLVDRTNGQIPDTARTRLALLVAGAYSSACGGSSDDPLVRELCAEGNHGQGWLGAGAWYMHMARYANDSMSLHASRPSFSPVVLEDAALETGRGLSDVDRSTFGRLWQTVKRGIGVTDDRDDYIIRHAAELQAALDKRWRAAWILAASGGSNVGTDLIDGAFLGTGPRLMDGIRLWLSDRVWSLLSPSAGSDPMVQLVEMGNMIAAIGGVLVGGPWVGELLSVVGQSWLPLDGAGALGSIASAVGELSRPVGIALLGVGTALAFIMPVMPFLLWTAAVTAYFILIAEAIVAVNLWAVAHMRMDGEGLAGEAGRQGYYLVLALTLTPVLMVFGFLLGMAIFKVTTTLINIGFRVMISGLMVNNWLPIWLIGMVVIGILMIITYFILAERSFSLTAELPGKVLRWIGADAQVTSAADDRIRVAAAGAGYQTTQLLSGLARLPQRRQAGIATRGISAAGRQTGTAPVPRK